MKLWAPLLALVVLAGPIAADEMDKPKLRQLAKPPNITTFTFGIGFSTSDGFIEPKK